MDAIRIVLCNAPVEHAERLAELLISQRLAACVNVSAPIRSIYHWEGKCEWATEQTLAIKTTLALLEPLRTLLCQEHPYALPEIIAMPIDEPQSHPRYLDWIRAEVAEEVAVENVDRG